MGIKMAYDVKDSNVRMMPFFCETCKEVKAIPARRGRPPKHCQECLGSDKVESYDVEKAERDRAIANAKVDRLEFLLRSRGTHISQNRDKYDR